MERNRLDRRPRFATLVRVAGDEAVNPTRKFSSSAKPNQHPRGDNSESCALPFVALLFNVEGIARPEEATTLGERSRDREARHRFAPRASRPILLVIGPIA